LVSINAVALHPARLVLGWVTAFGAGKPSHYVTSYQTNSAWPSMRMNEYQNEYLNEYQL